MIKKEASNTRGRMQLGKMKVTRREGGAITVQEFLHDEEGCFVSKPGSDRIEGRYLHELAEAVADVQPKVDALVGAVSKYLKALDQRDNSASDQLVVVDRLKSLRYVLEQYEGDTL